MVKNLKINEQDAVKLGQVRRGKVEKGYLEWLKRLKNNLTLPSPSSLRPFLLFSFLSSPISRSSSLVELLGEQQENILLEIILLCIHFKTEAYVVEI